MYHITMHSIIISICLVRKQQSHRVTLNATKLKNLVTLTEPVLSGTRVQVSSSLAMQLLALVPNIQKYYQTYDDHILDVPWSEG